MRHFRNNPWLAVKDGFVTSFDVEKLDIIKNLPPHRRKRIVDIISRDFRIFKNAYYLEVEAADLLQSLLEPVPIGILRGKELLNSIRPIRAAGIKASPKLIGPNVYLIMVPDIDRYAALDAAGDTPLIGSEFRPIKIKGIREAEKAANTLSSLLSLSGINSAIIYGKGDLVSVVIERKDERDVMEILTRVPKLRFKENPVSSSVEMNSLESETIRKVSAENPRPKPYTVVSSFDGVIGRFRSEAGAVLFARDRARAIRANIASSPVRRITHEKLEVRGPDQRAILRIDLSDPSGFEARLRPRMEENPVPYNPWAVCRAMKNRYGWSEEKYER